MTIHATTLRARRPVADGTAAFQFDKPAGFVFEPGQAIDVVLPQPPGGEVQSARHTFSIVSAPFESELVIATRTRDSAFKSRQAWQGSTGPINEALLTRAVEGLAQPVYAIAGPPAMAESLRLVLNDAGVDDQDIRSEAFYGY